jgi:signal transduction histidine kinase
MNFGRPTVRLFLLAVAAAVPPLIVAVVALAQERWATALGSGTLLLIVVLAGLGWAAIVAVLGGRVLGSDLQGMLELAERGHSSAGGGAIDRLATMLEERNRQIAELATTLRDAPIQADVRELARSVVRGAISVTGDPTWKLAVLRSPRELALPPGVYSSERHGEPESISQVATWAATIEADDAAVPAVRYGLGPWGAFVAVEVAAGDELRASLIAPWEGRTPPSRAERELLSLLGQNAAIAIEHSLLVEQLRTQKEELDRMAGVQSDFLRGVTHDLQTPLASIRAVAAELGEQPGLEASARNDLETIGHQADRLRRMVSQLLAASRLEAGALQPASEIFRVEPVVRRTWDALRSGRRLNMALEGHPFLVVADPNRLEQVLWAVFDNAVKYSPQGSPVEVLLSTDGGASDGLTARIAIADQGAGMDAESAERAFEQFYRAPDARRLAPDGSGVGLYAARGLIEAMGGTISLESRMGSGTHLTIWLPAERVEDDSGTVS